MTQARPSTTCKSSKKCGVTDMADMTKLKAADWVALRLLYIMISSDPSTVSLPDVQKAVQFYERKLRPKGGNKYSSGHIQTAFALLNKDIPYDGVTFTNPEVRLTRDVAVKKYYSAQEYDDAGQWYTTPDTVRKEMEKRNG